MAAEGRTIEKSFDELNEIIQKMDDDSLPLEDTFKLYEKGIKLVKQCNDRIDRVEKKLKVIENGRKIEDE